MNNFAKFLSVNGLKRKEIASFLGVSGAFISQLTSGDRPIPAEKLAQILNNAYGWDISMLTPLTNESVVLDTQFYPLSGLDSVRPQKEITPELIRSAAEMALSPDEKFLIGYLERKIENQDTLIRELYQKIGMLEAKLELTRKGEIASVVGGSSDADAV